MRLLKCLCQTDAVKRVSWFSGAAGGQGRAPQQFETTSKVIIIANDWKTLSENVHAVQNCGHLIVFEPSAEEVHHKVAEWFWDVEIFDWIGEHLHLLPRLTMRHYIRASELKAAGMDWFDVLVSEGFSPKTLLVARLRADGAYPDEASRVSAFKALGGGSRSSYFSHAKKLKGPGRFQTASMRLENPKRARAALRVVGGAE